MIEQAHRAGPSWCRMRSDSAFRRLMCELWIVFRLTVFCGALVTPVSSLEVFEENQSLHCLWVELMNSLMERLVQSFFFILRGYLFYVFTTAMI